MREEEEEEEEEERKRERGAHVVSGLAGIGGGRLMHIR